MCGENTTAPHDAWANVGLAVTRSEAGMGTDESYAGLQHVICPVFCRSLAGQALRRGKHLEAHDKRLQWTKLPSTVARKGSSMSRMFALLAGLACCLFASWAFAVDAPAGPQPLMTERGKLLFSDDFSQP